VRGIVIHLDRIYYQFGGSKAMNDDARTLFVCPVSSGYKEAER
jgi:hypothetical protein